MMPALYSLFPAPLGGGHGTGAVVEGTNSAWFMHYFPEERGARPNSRWTAGQTGKDNNDPADASGEDEPDLPSDDNASAE
jgi:hypothetical protein